jgi:hypothetical protein
VFNKLCDISRSALPLGHRSLFCRTEEVDCGAIHTILLCEALRLPERYPGKTERFGGAVDGTGGM